MSIMGGQYFFCTNFFRWNRINIKSIFCFYFCFCLFVCLGVCLFVCLFWVTWFSMTWYYKNRRWNSFFKKHYSELTECKHVKWGWVSKMYQGCSTRVLQHLQGVLLPQQEGPAEQHSKWEKQVPDSVLPRICTNPWRRGHLAAIFTSFQMCCTFPKELWIQRAADHGGDLCNLLLESKLAL